VTHEVYDARQKLFKGLPLKGYYLWAYIKVIYVLLKVYLYMAYLGLRRCYTSVNPTKGYLGILKAIGLSRGYVVRAIKGHIKALQ
jgi:hypothetical protein